MGGGLAAAYLTVKVLRVVFLQDMDAIPPVHPIKVVPKSASGAGRPGAICKGAWTFHNLLEESNLIYLVEVFVLAYR